MGAREFVLSMQIYMELLQLDPLKGTQLHLDVPLVFDTQKYALVLLAVLMVFTHEMH